MTRNRNRTPVTVAVSPPADNLAGVTGTLHKDPPPIYRELARLLGDPTAAADDDRVGNTATAGP
ncbi:hypothetical protein LFM09_44890 [Lentzea alba]|uniref:hypothetical protein n=1 Tax=Lentzea alba TaxID=2714351 RepID=UPI0039BF1C78